jgi:hypothetical protein
MATVINNPPDNTTEGGNAGLIIGLVLAAIIVFLFIAYGLPAMRGQNSGTNINVPDRVDLNVNNPSN